MLTMIGLLSLGKSDFENVNEFHKDEEFYKIALGICIVFDLFGWGIIKHPWSLSFKEFYADYQPWITLIYIAILIGPIIGYFFTGKF